MCRGEERAFFECGKNVIKMVSLFELCLFFVRVGPSFLLKRF